MNDEKMVLAAIAQGQMVDLVKSGVFNWKFPEPYQSLFHGCQVLFLRGDTINLLSLFGECKLSPETWKEVKETWREAKTEERVNWKPAAERIISRGLSLEGKLILSDTASALSVNGRSPRVILSSAWTQLSTLLNSGSTYNPTPSYHYENSRIGEFVGTTGLDEIDTLLQGGLWSQALIIFVMPSNHGKSTFAYTMLAHAVANKRRSVLFTFETNTATAVARILSAYSGISVDETTTKKWTDINSEKSVSAFMADIDEYVSVYDGSFNSPEKMEQVVRIIRPGLFIVDHLGMIDPNSAMKNANRFDQFGDVADAVLRWTIDYNCTGIVNAQLANDASVELKKHHDLEHTRIFGSSRIYNAADFVIIGLRHWTLPCTAYLKLKKNRKNGIVDIEGHLGYDPKTQSYHNAEIKTITF